MVNPAPAASARPDIISLDVLLNDVDEGRVQIPQFQRPYVWTPAMKKDLFESVLSGYPIGSLLFWAPRDVKVVTTRLIGPLNAPSPPPHYQVALVIDGHQRLATLYGVLRLPESHPRDAHASADDLSWWLGYDLEAEETRQMRRPDDFDNPRILPLRTVLRTSEFVRFARGIDSDHRLTELQKTTYLDRADKVQRAIRDYRIALTNMRDGTVNDAVAIFSRINRSGRRMTTDQMAVALTYHEGFNLEETLNNMLAALEPFGFSDVSRTVVLQSLLQGAGRDFISPNFDNLRQQDTLDSLRSATAPVTRSLVDAARFLGTEIGFATGKLLPYALQFLLLSIFFRTTHERGTIPHRTTLDALRRWFWATSFSGWFASANTSEIAESVTHMTAFAKSPNFYSPLFEDFFFDRPLRPFPKTFDRRSARIRALLLVQIARGLLDPVTGYRIDASELMANIDRREFPPYVFLPIGGASSRSPANRILLSRQHGRAVRSVLVGLSQSNSALASHGIDGRARQALEEKDLDAFVVAREAALEQMEREFLSAFHLRIDGKIARSESETDVEDL